MKNDWICIYSTGKYYRAQFARELLTDEGVESVIIDKTDSSGYMHPSGFVEVFVRRGDVIKAMHLLKTAQFE